MRLLLIIALICAGGYWLTDNKPQFNYFSKEAGEARKKTQVQSVTLDQARRVILQTPGPKVVAIGASWCPACKAYFPEYAKAKLPPNVKRFGLSLDTDEGKMQKYAKEVGGDITWFRLTNCAQTGCQNGFRKMGIDFDGGIPHFTAMNAKNKIIADGLPVETLQCTYDGSCIVTCKRDAGCNVKRVAKKKTR